MQKQYLDIPRKSASRLLGDGFHESSDLEFSRTCNEKVLLGPKLEMVLKIEKWVFLHNIDNEHV